jgi:hypothetical protein
MPTRIHVLAVTLGLLAATAAGEVAAHHGWSGYDSDTTLTLTGVIQAAGYEHPHAYLRLATPDKNWLVVLAPPSRMENRGLSRTMLQEGTPVTVVGYPHRSASDEMRAERMTMNGTTVELR